MAHVLSSFPASLQRVATRPHDARLRGIVAAHFEVVWRLLRRLGVPESEVDDAVQEVIVVLARRIDEVESGHERAFVLSTAYRVASTVRRTLRRRRETSDDPLGDMAHGGDDPEALLAQRRARELLDQVLATLPIDLRAVFVLYELERCTCAEIAEVLSIPAGTAASRLRRARAAFAVAIERVQQTLEPATFPSHPAAGAAAEPGKP